MFCFLSSYIEPALFSNLDQRVFYRGMKVSFDFHSRRDSFTNMGWSNSDFFDFQLSSFWWDKQEEPIKKKRAQIENYVSTSGHFGIANSFGHNTMFVIINPKYVNDKGQTIYVDATWISKIPEEKEVIMGLIDSTAIFSPKQFYCKCDHLSRCFHAKYRVHHSRKIITIDP